MDDVSRVNERDAAIAGHHVGDPLMRRERGVLPLEDRVLRGLVLPHRAALDGKKEEQNVKFSRTKRLP